MTNSLTIHSLYIYTGVGTIAAGSYHGYCDAQNIPILKENLEWLLIYSPTLVQGGIGASIGGLIGFLGGGILGSLIWEDNLTSRFTEKVTKCKVGSLKGTLIGAGFLGTIGATRGAFQTSIGYCLGYFAGSII